MEHPHPTLDSIKSEGYFSSHSPLKVIGVARIAFNCALASKEVSWCRYTDEAEL